MVVPTGQTTRRSTCVSYDVLHGFYVPQFNFSRYASPGYWTSFDLDVLHTGIYRGQCTQLCGLYHSLMFFNVRGPPPRQYADLAGRSASSGHPSSIGQLPASVHANQNGTVPSYSAIGTRQREHRHTGGALYGD